MSSSHGNPGGPKKQFIAGVDHYGALQMVPSGHLQTMIFNVYNFEQLAEKFKTGSISCAGYDWCLSICPSVQGHVSIFLERLGCEDDREVIASPVFRCKAWTHRLGKHTFQQLDLSKNTGPTWGLNTWIERSKVLGKFLDSEGTLRFEADIDVYVEKKYCGIQHC
jgi:hypothetical protein